MTEIRNALIEDTKLGEDHGLLTATLYLSGEGWGGAVMVAMCSVHGIENTAKIMAQVLL